MGQTILITGANRGIGLALATELLEKGHRVLAAARHPARAGALEKLRDRHKGALEILQMDVTSDESVAKAAAGAPPLDILVNNAAVFPEEGDESIFAMDLEHFREAFETNVLGVVRVSRAFFPRLEMGNDPRIVNISSGAGSVAGKDDSSYYAYSASKAALNMVTRAMAAEFRGRGVCVVAMTPGWVRTDMGGSDAPLSPGESATAIAKTITALTMEKSSHFIDRTGAEVSYGW
ncbi:MAG TPA: SDR family oxidoreductase [Chthoniobacteraceae bacterium]|jgi:NAD(P)-dependent dehydrogenase (short-subunit alcohol dehydrogenase family)|nr:SDR family oxidoreductase [Chthoniobacteraceae bacterium]